MKVFTLTDEEEVKFNEWRKSKKNLPSATIGGAYTFKFTPTGVGTFIEVECVDGSKLDLNDYDRI